MDPSVEAQLQALSDGLDRGLFSDNLHALIEIAKDIVMRSDGPVQLAAFMIETVLADLEEMWDGPVPRAAYEQVNAELGPALKRIVEVAIDPAHRVFLPEQLQALVRGFVALQVSQSVR